MSNVYVSTINSLTGFTSPSCNLMLDQRSPLGAPRGAGQVDEGAWIAKIRASQEAIQLFNAVVGAMHIGHDVTVICFSQAEGKTLAGWLVNGLPEAPAPAALTQPAYAPPAPEKPATPAKPRGRKTAKTA